MEDGCGVVGKYHCFNFKQFFLFLDILSVFLFPFWKDWMERFWEIACKIYSREKKNLSFRANSENREKSLISLNEQS